MNLIKTFRIAVRYLAVCVLMFGTAYAASNQGMIYRHAPPPDPSQTLGVMALGLIWIIFGFVACATFPTYRRLRSFFPRWLPKIKPRAGGQ